MAKQENLIEVFFKLHWKINLIVLVVTNVLLRAILPAIFQGNRPQGTLAPAVHTGMTQLFGSVADLLSLIIVVATIVSLLKDKFDNTLDEKSKLFYVSRETLLTR